MHRPHPTTETRADCLVAIYSLQLQKQGYQSYSALALSGDENISTSMVLIEISVTSSQTLKLSVNIRGSK